MSQVEEEEIVVDEFVSEEDLKSPEIEELQKRLRKELSFTENYDNFIVVDNLPVIEIAKVERLLAVITRIYMLFDKELTKEKVTLPVGSDGNTKGFAFIEFSTPEFAKKALIETQGKVLDRNHIFKVSTLYDFEKYANTKDEFEYTQLKDTTFKENLRWWISDPNEQFALRYADETEVMWTDTIGPPKSIKKMTKWSDKYIQWSTFGSYIISLHQQGIILWGGEEWTRVHRLQHVGVAGVQFSPQEKYLVTYSPTSPPEETYVIWETVSGKRARKPFPAIKPPPATYSGVLPQKWPIFKWTHDDKYFARILPYEGAISFYETPSMEMINNKSSLRITDLRAFEWSPKGHTFVCWCHSPSTNNAKIIVYSVPTLEILYQKSYFSVHECQIEWQDQGKYFCVRVDQKIKKKTATTFEFFSATEKGFPVQVYTFSEKEKIINFKWEPKGLRFAIIHGDISSHQRYNVTFLDFKNPAYEVLTTLEGKQANSIIWSPMGHVLLLAAIKEGGGGTGQLEFFNVDLLESMGEAIHDSATEAVWDPSGRYVCTYSSAWQQQNDNGYIIWSFKGDQIHKLIKDKFFQFVWRPRPPTLLSEQQEEEIKSKLKEYTKKYRKIIKIAAGKASDSQMAARDALQKEFDLLVRSWNSIYASEKAKRTKIRGYDSDDEKDKIEVEEEREEIIDEQEIEN